MDNKQKRIEELERLIEEKERKIETIEREGRERAGTRASSGTADKKSFLSYFFTGILWIFIISLGVFLLNSIPFMIAALGAVVGPIVIFLLILIIIVIAVVSFGKFMTFLTNRAN